MPADRLEQLSAVVAELSQRVEALEERNRALDEFLAARLEERAALEQEG